MGVEEGVAIVAGWQRCRLMMSSTRVPRCGKPARPLFPSPTILMFVPSLSCGKNRPFPQEDPTGKLNQPGFPLLFPAVFCRAKHLRHPRLLRLQ